MRKFIISIFLFLFVISSAFSQIELASEDRIANTSDDGLGGYCAWCCIETLGRYHKIDALYGLKEKRTKLSDFKHWDKKLDKWIDEPYIWVENEQGQKVKTIRNIGDWTDIKNVLNKAKVKYLIQETGIKNTDVIKYAIDNDFGCMIVINVKGGTHAIIIQNYDKDKIRIFDPNDPKINYTAGWDWLDQNWTGYALVIQGKK